MVSARKMSDSWTSGISTSLLVVHVTRRWWPNINFSVRSRDVATSGARLELGWAPCERNPGTSATRAHIRQNADPANLLKLSLAGTEDKQLLARRAEKIHVSD